MAVFRFLLGVIYFVIIAYLDFSFLVAKIFPSEADNFFVADFQGLVIANLIFLMFYIVKDNE